jgi:uncharacterized protein
MINGLRTLETDVAPVTSHDEALERELLEWFRAHKSVLVGFSGGVDSAYLACVAVDAIGADNVLSVIGRSASYPAEQWARARAVADRFAVPVLEVSTDEVSDPRYAANPSNRCYFCKTELWDVLVPLARDRELNVVVDGTNADDLSDHRPGARAAAEHGVRSPLAELRFTKDAIRRLSKARGIETWSQPSSPCLSSRIPYGTQVTPDRLRQVERAESALRALGVVGDLRVRYHGDLARIELNADVVATWLAPSVRASLADAARAGGFDVIAIDLRGFRSGSLNVLGGVVAEPLVRARASSGSGDVEGLTDALRRMEVSCDVTARARLAVIRCTAPRDTDRLIDGERRRAVVEMARGFGFTHVALEIEPAPRDATVRRD